MKLHQLTEAKHPKTFKSRLKDLAVLLGGILILGTLAGLIAKYGLHN